MVLIGINSVIDGLQLTVIRDEMNQKNSEATRGRDSQTYEDKESQQPDLIKEESAGPLAETEKLE